ncbi:unnamed protein product [Coffea canephora]|uniref:Uncharacterized protein n=1 Tax=Coffea canephora TaxID=49390 RepID=A0A068UHF1_COFCA|nr:unnamed protein product [Coffea canephora]
MQAFMRAKQYYVHANITYGLAHQSERSKQRLSQHSRRQSLSSECQCPHGFSEPRDGEFHVASLPCNPDLNVMSDLRDATTGDPNVVHSCVSMKECEKYNKMKMAKGITRHKHSLRQPSEGWSSIVNELRPRREGKNAGSIQDGSTRPPNPYEKMYVRRETPRQCRRILPLF